MNKQIWHRILNRNVRSRRRICSEDTMNTTNFKPRPLTDIAQELGIDPASLEFYGHGKAKFAAAPQDEKPRGKGRLILVTAINPTPAGEGKTTTSIALAMGLRQLGKKAVLALREPSLGPVFGVKGGGTGGGRASLVPADDINLHFTGDIHAITSAHNLLSALIDNALYHRDHNGGVGELDSRQITWNRCLDMNDRSLRHCIVGLGGKTHGVARETKFDITAASEIMAILALAKDQADLQARIERIVVGYTHESRPVTAKDLGAAGALTALLRDALKPNLVQTTEGGAAFVHCGPFANIAHGCNSIQATKLALHYGDYAVTEAGFGFDLGGEKFLNIKCRQEGIWPRVVVVVATLRALKMHGGAPVKAAQGANAELLQKGLLHLTKHLENAHSFGLTPVVALNVFPADSEEELATVEAFCKSQDALVARSEGFGKGGAGALDLARIVCQLADATDANPPQAKFSYTLDESPKQKMTAIAQKVYGAKNVEFTHVAERDLKRIAEQGHSGLPLCMAKTQLSLSDEPTRVGRPEHFTVTVREVRLCAGAGFLVALTGEMMTMPGLPKIPAARDVRLLPDGTIKGLMQND